MNDIIRTYGLDNCEFDPVDPWRDILAKLALATRSLYRTTLNTTPGQLVVSQGVLFGMQFTRIGRKLTKGSKLKCFKIMKETTINLVIKFCSN